jgi:hypothetical protein
VAYLFFRIVGEIAKEGGDIGDFTMDRWKIMLILAFVGATLSELMRYAASGEPALGL